MVSDRFTKMDVTPNIVFLRAAAWILLMPACMLYSPRLGATCLLGSSLAAVPFMQSKVQG